MKLMLVPVSIVICSVIAPILPCLANADPLVPVVSSKAVPRNRPCTVTLEGRRVMSISGDAFVYNLGSGMIVITSDDDAFRSFLAKVKEGHREAKITVTLVPELKSLYNARFQAFLMHHPQLSKF
ncbi:MAG TPA: hypothetical protein VI298_11535 [Geobacteraceae bacterium]